MSSQEIRVGPTTTAASPTGSGSTSFATSLLSQLSSLVVLASCAVMAAPQRKEKLPPEVLEFMQYPVQFQRQMLDYGRRYVDASFEAKISSGS